MRIISRKEEDCLVMPDSSAINRCLRLMVGSAVLTCQFLSIAIRFFHCSFMEVLFVVLQVFLQLLTFTVILLSLYLFGKPPQLFLMSPFHLEQSVIELLLHFRPFFVEGGVHELPFQLHLLHQISLIFVKQPLLVSHHQLQFDYLLLPRQFDTLHLLQKSDIGHQIVLCRKIQSFQLFAVLPQE